MHKKEDVTYILKHDDGFYVKTSTGHIELTESIERAKKFEPNEKVNSDIWQKLYSDPRYTVLKRTEITTVDYREVESVE